MKKVLGLNKAVGLMLSASLLFTSTLAMPAYAKDIADTQQQLSSMAAQVSISEAAPWFEGAYVKWSAFNGAEWYAVYYKSTAKSNYTKLDSRLIRKYADYYRADILGLLPGDYNVKVVPVVSGSEVSESATEVTITGVQAFVREGFAFSAKSPCGNTTGGYNADGTLSASTDVIYLTNENKDTVTINGDKTKGEGIFNILAYREKNKSITPMVIRVLGKVEMPTGVADYMLGVKSTKNITIEGVGDDATIHGYGLTFKRAQNIEVRNLGIMWYGGVGGDGDSLSLDTENKNIWIHNCDFFYGAPGKDSDQAKGDGSIDLKAKSDYITVDYCHFWDSGKANVSGGVWESKNPDDPEAKIFVNYHHNWFDHSDSRHPRCVAGSTHVYNNYYDGNAVYGIGAAVKSSVFVENNYFRNCPRPMIIASQGSDVYDSVNDKYADKGTLSGQDGGMIKSYGNVITTPKMFYDQNNTPHAGQIDAYTTNSREEKVPETVTAMKGGSTYNNFDTDPEVMYEYKVDTAEEAVVKVKAYAGRIGGGDFKWTFTDADDGTKDIIPELQNAVQYYQSSLAAVSPELTVDITETTTGNDGSTETTTEGTTNSDGSTETTTINVPAGSRIVHNFGVHGLTSDIFTFSELCALSNSKGTVEYDGLTLTECLKVGSDTHITFTAPGDGELTLVFNPANGKVNIKVNGQKTVGDAVTGILTIPVTKGTFYQLDKHDSSNLFYMVLTVNGGDESTTEDTTASVTESTTEDTTASVTESTTEETTVSVTESTTENTTVSATESTTEGTTTSVTETTTEATETTTETTTENTSAVYMYGAVGNDNQGIKLVAGVESLKYKEVGFIIEANGKSVTRSTGTVYTSIAGGESFVANVGTYQYSFDIDRIGEGNKDVEIKVTPYAIDLSGKRIEAESITVKYVDYINIVPASDGDKVISDGAIIIADEMELYIEDVDRDKRGTTI